MKLFTFNWQKRREQSNHIFIVIKVVDLAGKVYILNKRYREWFGICTTNIEEFAQNVRCTFKSCSYERLGNQLFRPTFPIFHDRLQTEDMNYLSFPFYKVYVDDANVYEVGLFYSSKYNVAYYEESQWRTRLYLDFYTKFQCNRFYYSWYDIDFEDKNLLSSFQQWYTQDIYLPPIGIASFDLETVPWDYGSNRFPNGYHPYDVITMISLVTNGGIQQVYYLLPRSDMKPIDNNITFIPFTYELDMIIAFLDAIQDSSILLLTGYNILSFDLPCLVARLVYYAQENDSLAKTYLNKFSSFKVGTHVVATFGKKTILDMYHYILTFSNVGLTDHKLDNVASVRLKETKVAISPVAIHKWYQSRKVLPINALNETNLDVVYDQLIDRGLLSHDMPKSAFGTFKTCLFYCLKDSQLVLRLLEKENALQFLTSRSNMCTMNLEEALYYGNSKYVECVLQTYGTTLGFFVDLKRFKNINYYSDDEKMRHSLCPYATPKKGGEKYQGALNYGDEMSFHQNVTCYDFESLYPSVIMVFNLSPDTFTIVSSYTYFNRLSDKVKSQCIATNFSTHSDVDFMSQESGENILSPPDEDKLVIIYKNSVDGFIPKVLYNVREMRRLYKTRMSKSTNKSEYNFNYNNQLMYKLLMNSLYGCFGSDESAISNFCIAMSVTYFARRMLLASYHYCLSHKYYVCYCDTDSLFVVNDSGSDLATDITRYLGYKGIINLQKECQYKSMLIISKKKYCVRKMNDIIVKKGFEKKTNQMTLDLVDYTLEKCFASLEGRHKRNEEESKSYGWCLLQEILQKAWFESRIHGKQYAINRKVKALNEYSSKTQAPHVRLMKRLPNFHDKSVCYSYVFTDISVEGNMIMNPRLIQEINENSLVNFEQLIMSQKKNILSALNIAYFPKTIFNIRYLMAECNKMIQTMRWKCIVQSALLHKIHHGEDLLVCFEKKLCYSILPKQIKK